MAKIGDNTKISSEDRMKLFAFHIRKIIAATATKKAAEAEISAQKKLAKSQDPSFTSEKIAHYLRAFFGEDDQKPVVRLKSDRESLEWLGLIPATSGGDLLAQVDRVDREEMVRAKGYKAGLLNLDRVSGYDAGSVDDRIWLDSYDAGKREYEAEIPDILARFEKGDLEEPDADDPFADAAE